MQTRTLLYIIYHNLIEIQTQTKPITTPSLTLINQTQKKCASRWFYIMCGYVLHLYDTTTASKYLGIYKIYPIISEDIPYNKILCSDLIEEKA